MTKAVTVRLDDETYTLLAQKAKAERRSLANYIEYAASNYAIESDYVSDKEMKEILADKELQASLKRAQKDIVAGRGKRVY